MTRGGDGGQNCPPRLSVALEVVPTARVVAALRRVRHRRSEVLPCSARASAWVRCGPQNCSPFCGALLHGLPFVVVAEHLLFCSLRAAPTALMSVSVALCESRAVAG